MKNDFLQCRNDWVKTVHNDFFYEISSVEMVIFSVLPGILVQCCIETTFDALIAIFSMVIDFPF